MDSLLLSSLGLYCYNKDTNENKMKWARRDDHKHADKDKRNNLVTDTWIARHNNRPPTSSSCHGGYIEPFFPLLAYPLEWEWLTYFIRLLTELCACKYKLTILTFFFKGCPLPRAESYKGKAFNNRILILPLRREKGLQSIQVYNVTHCVCMHTLKYTCMHIHTYTYTVSVCVRASQIMYVFYAGLCINNSQLSLNPKMVIPNWHIHSINYSPKWKIHMTVLILIMIHSCIKLVVDKQVLLGGGSRQGW